MLRDKVILMKQENGKNTFTRTLTIIGTLLVWTPLAFTVFTSAIGTLAEGRFLFDYLMPAELYPFALVGALLLLWAALRSQLRIKIIVCSSVMAAFFLAGSMVTASVVGPENLVTKLAGIPFIMVITLLILYEIVLIGIGAGGILLWKDLFSNLADKKRP